VARRSGLAQAAALHRSRLAALELDAALILRIETDEVCASFPGRIASVLSFADLFGAGEPSLILSAAPALTAAGLSADEVASLARSLAGIAFAGGFTTLLDSIGESA
jgi:hypothetical protein